VKSIVFGECRGDDAGFGPRGYFLEIRENNREFANICLIDRPFGGPPRQFVGQFQCVARNSLLPAEQGIFCPNWEFFGRNREFIRAIIRDLAEGKFMAISSYAREIAVAKRPKAVHPLTLANMLCRVSSARSIPMQLKASGL